MTGVKHDQDKSRLDLIPVGPLIGAGNVFAYGAKKYSERNWENGLEYSRLYRACIGHIMKWWQGHELDDEEDGSGMPHLDHAMCCLLMLHEMRRIHPEMDNRPKIPNIKFIIYNDIAESVAGYMK